MIGAFVLFASLQLVSAEVSIDLNAGRVTARYEMAASTDTVVFLAANVGAVTDFEGPGRLVESAGLYRVVSPAGGSATLSYRVVPRDGRVPIFVPDVPTEAAQGAVRITMTGVGDDARVADGFPRMTRRSDGVVEAVPANVPSFITIPPDGAFGVNQVGDGFVILLLVASSLYWIVRRRRA